jgi:hypothetical protein
MIEILTGSLPAQSIPIAPISSPGLWNVGLRDLVGPIDYLSKHLTPLRS